MKHAVGIAIIAIALLALFIALQPSNTKIASDLTTALQPVTPNSFQRPNSTIPVIQNNTQPYGALSETNQAQNQATGNATNDGVQTQPNTTNNTNSTLGGNSTGNTTQNNTLTAQAPPAPQNPPVQSDQTPLPEQPTPPTPQSPAQLFPQPTSTNSEPVGNWWNSIVSICHDKWNLDPYFVAAIVKHESWFNESAFNAGERTSYEAGQNNWFGQYYGKGLTQITGPWIAGTPLPQEVEWQYNIPQEAQRSQAPTMNNPYNGPENLDRGCWYMKALYTRYSGNYLKVAAAYRYGFFGVDAGTYGETSSYAQETNTYWQSYLHSVGR
ncbi:MAG: transglycosylase SLT domain-containing protein [Candidatus Micrarchaeota archaeon]